MRKIIGKKNKVHYVEETTRLKMVKSHKGWLVIGTSMFALGLGVLVTSQPVSADVVATSTSSSAVRAETTSANNSSAVNAETTSANNSSAVNAEMTGASSSSAVNAETTSASSSSAVNAETTSANNSSAVNAETTSASSSSAVNAEMTGASSSSAVNAETTSASSSSAVKTETTSAKSLKTSSSLVKGGVYASTYLVSNKNYYTDPAISRGFLDSPISKELLGDQNWNMFQVAVSKNLVSYNPGMTFNQYYLANNISPEDNFIVYPRLTNQIVRLKSGAYLNANPNPKGAKDDSGNVVDYITYVGPTDDRGAYWGDKELEDPVLFSRLTVGELPSASEGTLGLFNSGTYLFPTQIGYGENATVNDYMLTPGNDFIIPTRFNTIRNDVYLTMRSRAYFGAGLQGAQASLTATSNGKTVVGSSENSKFYIDTNSNVYLTKQGFDQLGNFGKFMAPSVYTSASNNLKKVGIDKFSAMMNKGLSSIQSNSGASTIVSGNGGQIQLSGFNRETDLDGAFSSSISDRENDALKNTDVNFYMYTNRNTETNVTTPLAPNGYHLYSPNVSEFKIQTTRPYFSWTGDISNAIKISEANADFDDLLGSNSLQVTDNGVDSDGKSISVDLNRVRIRISEDEGSTYSSNSYTLDELKTLLTSGNITIPKIVIAYTYSATDSKTDNIGKLPSEIDDNTGAYAVPFTRTLTNDIPDKKSNITVKYIDISGNTISDNIVKTGNVGEPYTTEQKSIPGYTFKEVQGSASGQFTDKEQTITYVYTKDPVAGANVTAKYVDENGKTISDDVVKNGNVGDSYTTEQKAIPGYTFKEVQGSASGQFTDKEQTITYVYTKDPVAGANVTAKYVDENGKTISDDVVKNGNVGDSYTTEQKAIPGYTFKEVQGSASGQFTDKEQTVTYVYTKDPVAGANVTAKYVDENGKTISDDVVKNGNVGDSYTTEQKAIPGYTFKEIQGSASGQFTDKEQTVTYVYTKDPVVGGNVTAKYVDEAGNTLSDNVVKSGNIGDDYSTEQKAIPGYTFKEVQGSASGQFTDKEQTITYVYTKDPVVGGNVTAKYVDEAGNTLSDNVVKSGNIGDDYSTEQKAIPGYTFKEIQGSASGQFTDKEQTVTYVYTKDPVVGGSVLVKYVDEAGNTLSDNVVKSGNIGDDYSTEQKAIPGYTFKEVQGSASGQFTDKEQTVTYVYTKDPVAGANVTAKYVDENGKTISDDVVKNGNVGDSYTTEQKAIPGYTFKEIQGSASGQFTDKEQTVTYVYTKDPVVGGNVTAKYVDEAGNTLSDNVVKSGNIGDDYSTEQKAIPGYTFKEVQGSASGQFTDKEQTITYVYTKDPVVGGNVTAKYVDEAGNTLSDNVVKSGNIGDDYSTEQKAIPGYTFKEIQGSASGQFTDKEQTVTYVYTKDPVVGGSVLVKYVDEAGNTLSDNVVKSGNIGDDYSTEQKAIPGYTFKEVQGSASGQFTDQEQTVTYVYTKDPVAGANVTAKYVDENGKTISDDVVKNGNVGDSYTTEQKAIPGYTFKEIQGSGSGQFTDKEQTVTYVYTKNSVTPVKPTEPGTTQTNENNTETPVKNTTNVSLHNNVSTLGSVSTTNEKSLPTTGEKPANWSVVVGGLITLTAATVLYLLKRKY